MERILIDTHIFLYMANDTDSLADDVKNILQDYNTAICLSAESIKELFVLYRRKRIGRKIWKRESDILQAIEHEYFIEVLPVDLSVMRTYSTLEINEQEDHNDPSDHIIISQAMTYHIPLVSSDRKFAYYRKQGLDLIYNAKS